MSEICNAKNISLFQYNSSIQKDFVSICLSLFQNTDINLFGYMRTFSDGKYLNLANNDAWIQYYVENILDLGTIFHSAIQKAEVNKLYYFLWPNSFLTDSGVKDPIFSALWDFNIWNGFSIYRRKEDGSVESWNFATDKTHQMKDFYLNNIPILEYFIMCFENKAQTIIDCSDSQKLAIFKNQMEFHCDSKDTLMLKKINKFLEETQIDRFLLNGKEGPTYLTKKELEIVYYVTLGKAIKEIARILEICPDKLDKCITKIKEKTGCHFKSDLASILSLNQLVTLRSGEKLLDKK